MREAPHEDIPRTWIPEKAQGKIFFFHGNLSIEARVKCIIVMILNLCNMLHVFFSMKWVGSTGFHSRSSWQYSNSSRLLSSSLEFNAHCSHDLYIVLWCSSFQPVRISFPKICHVELFFTSLIEFDLIWFDWRITPTEEIFSVYNGVQH